MEPYNHPHVYSHYKSLHFMRTDEIVKKNSMSLGQQPLYNIPTEFTSLAKH